MKEIIHGLMETSIVDTGKIINDKGKEYFIGILIIILLILFRVNGDIYSGDWIDDKLHGVGTFIRANGDKYEGEWFEDKI